jgi:polyhydroxyalkanoate synthase
MNDETKPVSAGSPAPAGFAIPNAFGVPSMLPQFPMPMPGMFPVDAASLMASSPEAFLKNMMTLIEQSGRVAGTLVERVDATERPALSVEDATEQARLWTEIWQHWMAEPGKAAAMQHDLLQNYTALWSATAQRMMGQPAEPVAKPEPGDSRFKDPEWSQNPYFDFWKQAYLLTSRWMTEALEKTDGLDERTRHRADFMIRQMVAAMSPTNNPMTNPEVMRETLKTSGANLVAGMENFNADLAQSGNMLKISQTDTTAFEVGGNIATTPGKVVFQNDIIQLIQYSPTTEQVREIPFVIVPPWINKFYILDLGPQKSFIKFAVDQGFTVFVVSWVNPDASLGHKTFEDYMREGILAATEAAKTECGTKRVNILGYCIGGTLLGTTLAYLAQTGEQHYNCATFLVAQVDFQKAGDLKLFIDEAQLKNIEKLMAESGYLDGGRMATVFNMLRPKDLIWPYIVNNYMLGKKPIPFDLLYWNQDSTRMPPANHSFYLREFYHENKLALGRMKIGGKSLDLGKVRLPIFHLATREDHISPPRSVFAGAKLFGGPVEFVLAGSGHIAGVVSPPGKTKYPYWLNRRPLSHPECNTLDGWIAGADEIKDSWWPHWAKWLHDFSGDMTRSRKPGAKLGTIEDAPGSYVKVKA